MTLSNVFSLPGPAGDMLLQGAHDKVRIVLLKDTIEDSALPSPRRPTKVRSSSLPTSALN